MSEAAIIANDLQSTTTAVPMRYRWVDLTVVFLVTCAVFAAVVPGPYANMDDASMLRDNPRYLNPTFGNFIKHFTEPDFNIFAPLTYSVWHVIAFFFVDQNPVDKTAYIGPMPFKVVSVLVHGIAALAAWRMMALFTRNRWAALLGALAFALHPVQVETVAWTTGLKDELCGLFSFLAIGSYIKYCRNETRREWVLTLAFVIAATLSKPTGVILPFTLLLVDSLTSNRSFELRLRSVSPFIVPAVISGAIMMHIQTPTNLISPVWARPLVAADALAFYLGKIVLPIHLVPDYARAPEVIIADRSIFWTWIIPVIVGILLWRFGSRRSKVAGALFVCPLLPVLGLLRFDMQQYSTVTDHYLYQSMLGVGLVVVILAEWGTAYRAALGGALAILGVLTVSQIFRWWDQRAMLEYNARVQPNSLMSHAGLASVSIREKNFDRAEREVLEAIRIRQRPVDYNNLSQIYESTGRYAEASAVGKTALDKGLVTPASLRLQFLRAKRMADRELAELTLKRWISVEPKNAELRKWLDLVTASKPASQPTTQPKPSQSQQ